MTWKRLKPTQINMYYGKSGAAAKVNVFMDDEALVESDDFWPENILCQKWLTTTKPATAADTIISMTTVMTIDTRLAVVPGTAQAWMTTITNLCVITTHKTIFSKPLVYEA